MTYDQFTQTNFYVSTREYMRETMFKDDYLSERFIETVLKDFYFRSLNSGSIKTIK